MKYRDQGSQVDRLRIFEIELDVKVLEIHGRCLTL
jgi:hypothetical protein